MMLPLDVEQTEMAGRAGGNDNDLPRV